MRKPPVSLAAVGGLSAGLVFNPFTIKLNQVNQLVQLAPLVPYTFNQFVP